MKKIRDITDGYYVLEDENGHQTNEKFMYINDACDGLYLAKTKDGEFLFFNENCNAVFGPFYGAEDFDGGYARVQLKTHKWRYLSLDGNVLDVGADVIYSLRQLNTACKTLEKFVLSPRADYCAKEEISARIRANNKKILDAVMASYETNSK